MTDTTTEPEPPPADDAEAEAADIADEDDTYAALGKPRDADELGPHLERNFTMASRRRVTLSVLTLIGAMALVIVAYLTVRADSRLDLGSSDASFTSAESEGFEERDLPGATGEPAFGAADRAPVDLPVVIAAGDGPRIDRVVTTPDPALLPVEPGAVTAALLTFRSRPAVAMAGPPGWYDGACLRLTPIDADGRPAAGVWVAAALGSCTGVAEGTGVVPACVGPGVLVVSLPEGTEIALDADGNAGSVVVDVIATADGYDEIVVSGSVVSSLAIGEWPAAIGDDGATLTLRELPGSPHECRIG